MTEKQLKSELHCGRWPQTNFLIQKLLENASTSDKMFEKRYRNMQFYAVSNTRHART